MMEFLKASTIFFSNCEVMKSLMIVIANYEIIIC